MSNQSFAAEQLLELLIQLKKSTPDAARQILNSQPQIAYALITLMVTMNAVNFEVFQKTLSTFGSTAAATEGPSVPLPATASALPTHLQPQPQYRISTPPTSVPPSSSPYTYPNGHTPPQSFGHGQPPLPPAGQPPTSGFVQGQPSSGYPNFPQAYSAPQPQTHPGGNVAAGMVPDALAAMPEEQKAMIMRVLTMTPEQINMLGPSERASIHQLKATLGMPSS